MKTKNDTNINETIYKQDHFSTLFVYFFEMV